MNSIIMEFLYFAIYISLIFFRPTLASTPKPVRKSIPRNPLHIFRRQAGYGPEHGQCDVGTTCKDSCGKEYEECKADTDLVLFCYNPIAGQKCCEDGNGKACDRNFYCTSDSIGATWCCPDALDVEACATSFGFDPLTTTTKSENPPSTTTTSPNVDPTTRSESPITSPLAIPETTAAPSINTASNYSTGGNISSIVPFTGRGSRSGDLLSAMALYLSPTLSLMLAFVSS